MNADETTDADGGPETETDPDRQDTFDRLATAAHEHGLFRLLGAEVTIEEPGRATMTMPFDDRFTNLETGTLHGGITATLIDSASGFALRSTFDDSDTMLTTTDLNVRYVRPAQGDVRCEAEVVRAGGSMGVTESTVWTTHEGEEVVVATGGTSYRLFRGGR